MKMNLDYKKTSAALLFLLCLSYGLIFQHDVHNVFLAIASLILAYGISCFFFEGKIPMIILFVLISVILCQTSVTVKKAIVDQDFRYQLEQDSAGVFVQDLIHGFSRIAKMGANNKDRREDSTFVERANSRYLTMAILGPIMIGFLVFKKST